MSISSIIVVANMKSGISTADASKCGNNANQEQSRDGQAEEARSRNPLDILANAECKIQSLTVSDQHATLLISHTDNVDSSDNTNNDDDENTKHVSGKRQNDETTKSIQSLLKLSLVPFHKSLLGSNPILSLEDRQNGANPERNSLDNFNLQASNEIISFLRGYHYSLKSDSGAEYSYHVACPSKELFNKINSQNNQQNGDVSDPIPNENNEEILTNSAVNDFGAFDIELISPATPHQISRAMPSLGHTLIHETPALYEKVAQPYIQSIVDNGSLGWIQNLIDLKKEKERLLLNHPDFIINIDTKWRSHPPPLTTPREEWYSHPSTADLYCLGIIKQSGIATLRDLRRKHISMLKALVHEGLSTIHTTYGVEKDQIRIFIHYQPQFYHFHVHFTRLENEVGCSVERGHLVWDVIQNLEMDDEYYCKRAITYKLMKGNPLQNLIESHLKENHDINCHD